MVPKDHSLQEHDENQSRLLNLAINFPDIRAQAIQQTHKFDESFQYLLGAMKADHGHTRELYQNWLEANEPIPKLRAANISIFNRARLRVEKYDNAVAFFERLEKHYKAKQAKDAAGRFKAGDNTALDDLDNLGVDTTKIRELKPETLPERKPTLKREPITINLSHFPQDIRNMTCSLSTSNDKLNPILHLFSAYAAAGAIIGKRFRCDNKGALIYPNLWIACLSETGTNKTGTKKIVEAAFCESQISCLIPSATTPAIFDAIGKVVSKKEWQDMKGQQRKDFLSQSLLSAQNDLDGKIFLSDECTGVIKNMLGMYDSKSPIKDVETVLQLSDSGSRIERATTGDGRKMIFDCCLSFLGYSQNETWNSEMGHPEFLSRGLFGRFLPVTAKYLTLENVQSDKTPFTSILADLANDAQRVQDAVKCVFGEPVGRGEVDFIGSTIAAFEASPDVQEFIQTFPKEWEAVRNKIIVHAIRFSMIDAFVEGEWKPNDGSVDCAKYFAKHLVVCSAAYAAYLWQRPQLSDFGRLEDKVCQLLRHEGPKSLRDIQRAFHFKSRAEAQSMLDGLVFDGILKTWKVKNPGTHSSTLFGVY